MKLIIKRWYHDISTLGLVHVEGVENFICFSLELPWLNNQINVSCIPSGIYKCRKIISTKNGECFEILNVHERTHIQGHIGNFTSDIEGCIVFGDSVKDLNRDGNPDVANSRVTFEKLMGFLPSEFILEVGL